MDLGKILENSGAILTGHFLLTSGRHSNIYFEKFRVLEQPEVLSALCLNLKEQLLAAKITPNCIAGPTTGGIIIAFELARQMGLPAVYVESENGQKTIRRGKKLFTGTKVFIVDDVLTTGRSVQEVREVIEKADGNVVGAGLLIDRSEKPLDFPAPVFVAHKVEAQSFAPDDVPEWLAQIPITKPGTRVEVNP